jgi:protein involved in polysaccharide export with SLBB domain
MKLKSFYLPRWSLLLLPALLTLLAAGCANFSDSVETPNPMAQPTPDPTSKPGQVARLHIGDSIEITFSGLPDPLESQNPTIKEDGTIILPDIGRVVAVGKTTGELEDAIHDLYVPTIYTHLTVTVKTSNDRVYYVKGEVKQPGRLIYTGDISVSKAITSAGDFTDFASRSDVMLIRADGKRYKLNINHIIDGEAQDPPVYPGDQIVVGRRIF